MENKNYETILNTGQNQAQSIKVEHCIAYHVIDALVVTGETT